MRGIAKQFGLVALVGGVIWANTAAAEEETAIGLGVGSLYNGVGVSFGKRNENSLKYLSVGCMSLSYNTIDGTSSNCGLGIGGVRTDMFGAESNKHGFGIHLGATYNDSTGIKEVEPFIAPQYVYFVNGIDEPGLTVGASAEFGRFDGDTKLSVGLNVGYQF